MHLSGYCFAEGPQVVSAVADALVEKAEYFTDFLKEESPESLVVRSNRSTAFFYLSRYLLQMSQWAYDAYLLDRSTAVDMAMTLVKGVRAESLLKRRSLASIQRQRALGFAEQILNERNRRKRDRAKRKNQQKGLPVVPVRGKTQRTATQKAQRAMRQEQLDSIFLPEPTRHITPPLAGAARPNRRSSERLDPESDRAE